MIIVTGASGFIGSCLVAKLNEEEHLRNIVVVDDFYKDYKEPNLRGKFILEWIHRDIFLDWFKRYHKRVGFVYHLGARTDTTEQDKKIFERLNINYSKSIWKICVKNNIPMVYASSAATYGLGENGYKDDHDIVHQLKPLNPYGVSKNEFDKWVLNQKNKPPHWAGLKFFNVYGPNEYHKGRMASVIFHTVDQIRKTGKMKLFRSHKKGVKNGEQSRDFIYVKDVVDICYFFYKKWQTQNAAVPPNGLYNIGTGKARTFLDLARETFKALEKPPVIEFIDTPEDIRATYQYYTQADITKLRKAGYNKSFYSLEEGVEDYVKNYLKHQKYW